MKNIEIIVINDCMITSSVIIEKDILDEVNYLHLWTFKNAYFYPL